MTDHAFCAESIPEPETPTGPLPYPERYAAVPPWRPVPPEHDSTAHQVVMTPFGPVPIRTPAPSFAQVCRCPRCQALFFLDTGHACQPNLGEPTEG